MKLVSSGEWGWGDPKKSFDNRGGRVAEDINNQKDKFRERNLS